MTSAAAAVAEPWLLLVGEQHLVAATSNLLSALRERGLSPSLLNETAGGEGPRRLPLTGSTPQSPLRLQDGLQVLPPAQLERWSIATRDAAAARETQVPPMRVGVLLHSPSLGQVAWSANPPQFVVLVGQSYNGSPVFSAPSVWARVPVVRVAGDGAGLWGPLCDSLASRP